MFAPVLCICVMVCFTECAGEHGVVTQDKDFNKLQADPELSKHVGAILDRLKMFKIAVHPRIRIFYELLKISMKEYAYQTADSLYVPDKYNVAYTKS